MIDNLSVLVNTNSRMLPLLHIFETYWNRNAKYSGKPYIMSDSFEGYNKTENFVYIESGEPFCGNGSHFRNTALKALKEIDSEYILFLCDDYILLDIDWKRIDALVKHMKCHDIDMCSFASNQDEYMNEATHESPDLGVTKDWIYDTPESFQYRFSVQACIWNKQTLYDVINLNENINLHLLDTSVVPNKPKDIKVICTNKKFNDMFPGWNPSDYILHYIEIIRWGWFADAHPIEDFNKAIIKEFGISLKEGSPYRQFLRPKEHGGKWCCSGEEDFV